MERNPELQDALAAAVIANDAKQVSGALARGAIVQDGEWPRGKLSARYESCWKLIPAISRSLTQEEMAKMPALVLAAALGHATLIPILMDWQDGWGNNFFNFMFALLWAAAGEHEETVRALLAKSTRDDMLQSTLSTSVTHGYISAVRTVLAVGADPGERDEDGDLVLHRAAKGSSAEIVTMLLNAAGGINATCRGRRTALMLAAEHGQVDVARTLISAGADVHALDKQGYSALLHAATHGHCGVAELLLNAGAELQPPADSPECLEGKSALLIAAKHCHAPMVRMLLERGASHVDHALYFAIIGGAYDVVQCICCARPDVNAPWAFGDTPIMMAVQFSRFEAARALIDCGVDVNPPRKHDTPLGHALSWRDPATVKALLEAGADMCPPVATRNSFLPWSTTRNAKGIGNLLFNAGYRVEDCSHWPNVAEGLLDKYLASRRGFQAGFMKAAPQEFVCQLWMSGADFSCVPTKLFAAASVVMLNDCEPVLHTQIINNAWRRRSHGVALWTLAWQT